MSPVTAPYTMREPCRWCMREDGMPVMEGYVTHVSGQDVVRCMKCNRQTYNAPKAETGKPQRVVRSREDLGFGQRERVLQRDNSTCLDCGRRPPVVILHVAHMVSVSACKEHGFTDVDYNDDDNLYAACEECNLNRGGKSLASPEMIRIFLLHNRAKREVKP